MVREYTRQPTGPDPESEQTHEDSDGLNEEDGEENVPGHWRDGYRRRRTPRAAENESRDARGQDNPDAEDRRGDHGDKRGVRSVGTVALSCRAAAIGLCLRQDSL